MAHADKFRIQHVAQAPRGWRVRTKLAGSHQVRIAFPPGVRRKGKGQLVEILHPAGENPCKLKNPSALVIFGNPKCRHKGAKANPPRGHKSGCKCVICKIRKRNPEGETAGAIAKYKQFHGKDPSKIVTRQRSAAMRSDYTGIGPCIAIGLYAPGIPLPTPETWEKYPHIRFKHDVKLACNAGGTQLYLIGGDQDCSGVVKILPGVDATKDLVDMGKVAFVVYWASKDSSRGGTAEYTHLFDAPRPSLCYDQIKKETFFVGGAYQVERPGIVH